MRDEPVRKCGCPCHHMNPHNPYNKPVPANDVIEAAAACDLCQANHDPVFCPDPEPPKGTWSQDDGN